MSYSNADVTFLHALTSIDSRPTGKPSPPCSFWRLGQAQNEALLRLLQVLRDRGSITAQEYEEIRKVAEAS